MLMCFQSLFMQTNIYIILNCCHEYACVCLPVPILRNWLDRISRFWLQSYVLWSCYPPYLKNHNFDNIGVSLCKHIIWYW